MPSTKPSDEDTLYDPALPQQPPLPLIGREQDLIGIKQRLHGGGNAALTVLHGLPGVGKTALATALAYDAEIRAYFSDGVLWTGLGPNPNIQSLLGRWAGLLGLSATQMALSGIEAWAKAIRHAIGARKMIVIIDDAWRLEDVQAMRVGAPNCAHLVTTRFRAIATQLTPWSITIAELDQNQSIQLLNRAAPAVVSHETQILQDLVQAVGGLPLALTLLGNYLRRQAEEPLSAVLERLSLASVRLQISEPQTPAESHPGLPNAAPLSLQSVIAVTDQLLPVHAQMTLYTLSVFPAKPNTFTEEAALAVAACTYDDLDALSDAGLLESNGERYTLHQVIADYAHTHLPDQEESLAYSRLILYITNYVEAHQTDYELLELESSTIRVTLETANAQGKQGELIRLTCAFAPFLILRGLYGQASHHLKPAYDAAVQLDDKEGITATLLYLGEVAQRLGNYTQAESYLQEGLSLARQMNNNERVCHFLTEMGKVFQEQGNFQEAETAYQEGLTLAQRIVDQVSICILLNHLGSLNMRCGAFTKSESYLQQGLALARKISDHERVEGLLRILGALEIHRGNFVRAQIYLQEGLTLAYALGDREQICALLSNLGSLSAQQGENAQAKRYFQEGLELARQIGHRERICSILINLGDVFVEEGNFLQAEISFQEGLELARQIGHREWMSIFLLDLGMSARKQGCYSTAKPYLQESLTLANQVSRPRVICAILGELGDLSLSLGNASQADEYFKEMRDLVPDGDQELLALAYYGLARVCAEIGDRENARLYGNRSLTTFEKMEHRNVDEVRGWMRSALDSPPVVEE